MLVLCFGLDLSLTRGRVCGFYCTMEASSLIREVHPPLVLFSWDVRGNLLDQVKSGRMCEMALLGLHFLAFRSLRDFPNLFGSGVGRSTIPVYKVDTVAAPHFEGKCL